MREDIQNKSKTLKVDKSKSSKCLLWFDRAKRILSDVDQGIGKKLNIYYF